LPPRIAAEAVKGVFENSNMLKGVPVENQMERPRRHAGQRLTNLIMTVLLFVKSQSRPGLNMELPRRGIK
jgi:hypothetical protein